jgi:hypothetical protein
MKITRALLAALGCLAVATALYAQGDGATGSAVPAEPTALCDSGPRYPSKWWAESNPDCSPCCYAYNHLAVPFDLTLRVGPSFIIGGNNFDEVLKTGVAFDVCGRGFCYDVDHAAAWTVEMGIASIFNPGDESVPVVRRLRFGTLVSDFGIRNLKRVAIQGAVGREWYWYAPALDGSRFLLGFDAGGRVGHANAQLHLVDGLLDLEEHHETDIYYGIFAGVNAWVLYPCWGYDFSFGLRAEIGRDWVEIVDGDDTLDQVQLLFVTGVRF